MPRLAPTLAALLFAAAVPAADAPKTPAEQFAALKAQYEADLKANTKVLKRDPVRGHVTESSFTPVSAEKYIPKLMELGKGDDEQTAMAALTLAAFAKVTGDAETRAAAFNAVLKRFAASPRMVEFLNEERSHGYTGQDARLKRMVAEVKDPTALGMVLYQYAGEFDPDRVIIQGEESHHMHDRIEKAVGIYERIISEFPKINDGVYAYRAKRDIVRLRQLRVGLDAPAIVGNDVAGKPMALADFKGKIVVLDFWGSWCGPCLSEMPKMRRLAAKYADDKGVVFLGVLAEPSVAAAEKAVAAQKVTWRNWFDKRNNDGFSPIANKWSVIGFPSVYVLDRQGVIRATNPHSEEEIDNVVNDLLKEAAGEGKE